MQLISKQNKQVRQTWAALETALKFTSSSNHAVSIPKNANNSFEYTSDWSIRLMCIHGSGSTEYIYHDLNTTTGKGFYIKASSGTSIDFYISDGTNNNTVSVAVPIGMVTFYKRITVTYTASSKTVMLRVGDFGSTTQVVILTSSIINTQSVTLGNNQALNSGLQGLLAFVSIYSKALTNIDLEDIRKEIGLVFKGLHSTCTGFWTYQEKYGDKVWDMIKQFNYAKGTPLVVNHGTLINYTGTELGTTTKTTQTSRVNYYDKTTTSFWDGSGNELKSGLPEMKGAWRVRTEAEAPSNYWLGHYVPTGGTGATINLTGGWSIVVTMRGYSFTGAGQSLYFTSLRVQSTGFTFQQTGGQILGMTIPISETDLNTYSVSVDSNGRVTVGFNNTFTTMIGTTFTDMSTRGWIILGNENNVMTGGGHYIRLGIWERPLEIPELIYMHNNSQFNNLTIAQQYKVWNYWLFNEFVTGKIKSLLGTIKIDLTPLDVAGNANELNPAHADYSIKLLSTIR